MQYDVGGQNLCSVKLTNHMEQMMKYFSGVADMRQGTITDKLMMVEHIRGGDQGGHAAEKKTGLHEFPYE